MNKQEILSNSMNADAKQWILWTNIFGIADSIIHSVYQAEKNKAPMGVLNALKGIHIALKNVDICFCDVANAIIEGKEVPGIILPPIEIDDWDDEGKTADGIIDALNSSVRLILGLIPPSKSTLMEMVKKSLEGLLKAFDEFKEIAHNLDDRK